MVRSICWLTMLLNSYICYVRYVKWMLWISFRIFGIRLRWSKVFFIRIFLLEKKVSHPYSNPQGGGGGTTDFKSNALPIAPTKRLRATKINAIYILNTQTTIVAKLLYGDAIYNVSAAQNTLSAITYARNVHFNLFNLRSPPESLLFKIMYNLPYFIPLGRIANSTLRECSEIVGYTPPRRKVLRRRVNLFYLPKAL